MWKQPFKTLGCQRDSLWQMALVYLGLGLLGEAIMAGAFFFAHEEEFVPLGLLLTIMLGAMALLLTVVMMTPILFSEGLRMGQSRRVMLGRVAVYMMAHVLLAAACVAAVFGLDLLECRLLGLPGPSGEEASRLWALLGSGRTWLWILGGLVLLAAVAVAFSALVLKFGRKGLATLWIPWALMVFGPQFSSIASDESNNSVLARAWRAVQGTLAPWWPVFAALGVALVLAGLVWAVYQLLHLDVAEGF